VDEEELNLVLLQLCDYLGSSNHLVSAFAFNELLKLAESRNVTPRQLFDPYWRSLAYLATKDMLQRPQRSRAFAELLQISVNELLVLIQTHALPWLVLDRRKEIIQRIAEARGESDVWRPLMDSSNLAAVLALLLAQESPNNTANFAKSRLEEISPHFQSEDMLSLLQSEPVLISMELLKAAGDSDATRKTAVRYFVRSHECSLTNPGPRSSTTDGCHGRVCQQGTQIQEKQCRGPVSPSLPFRAHGPPDGRDQRCCSDQASGD
jgi:serine/threonine-protein kinase ATR